MPTWGRTKKDQPYVKSGTGKISENQDHLSREEIRQTIRNNKNLDKHSLYNFFEYDWKNLTENNKKSLVHVLGYKVGSIEEKRIVNGTWRDIGVYNMAELLKAFKAKGWDKEQHGFKKKEQKYPKNIIEAQQWRKEGRDVPSRIFKDVIITRKEDET